jgi:geranylgeranyl pyrophosphate synthase
MPGMSDSATATDPLVATVETALAEALDRADARPDRLREAMGYALLGGGKRVRARLLLLTGDTLGLPRESLLPAACAVEMVHAYSLVHDDLPAMDDDDLRRGKPSTHRAYDEATAILVGDALLTLAFETLTDHAGLAPDIRLAQIRRLARAAGPNGMVAGQVLDMAAEGQSVGQPALEQIHRLKTGCLLQASVLLAADAAPDLCADARHALTRFADHLGLAFQVRDDLLDITSGPEATGKPQGSDLRQGKTTYPALLGLAETAAYCEQLHEQALRALGDLTADSRPLATFCRQLLDRSG